MCERCNIVEDILDYETGNMEPERVIPFFQHLIDTGMAWSLQGSYGRTAMALIESGQCTRSPNTRAAED